MAILTLKAVKVIDYEFIWARDRNSERVEVDLEQISEVEELSKLKRGTIVNRDITRQLRGVPNTGKVNFLKDHKSNIYSFNVEVESLIFGEWDGNYYEILVEDYSWAWGELRIEDSIEEENRRLSSREVFGLQARLRQELGYK